MTGTDTPPPGVRALIITPDGVCTVRVLRPDELAAAVGGYLELITPGAGADLEGWHAYVDEDGQPKRLPSNPAATLLAHLAGWYGMAIDDRLCGPVVFLGGDGPDDQGDVPEELVALARGMAHLAVKPRPGTD